MKPFTPKILPPHTPFINEIMNIRFIDDEIQVLYFGEYIPITINNCETRWVNLKYDEDDTPSKKLGHIFLANNPDWLGLDKIEVFVNGESKGIVEKTPIGPRNRLTACTLFAKRDVSLIPTWIEYYKKRGVEHFYLYFNDSLDSCVLPEIEGVTYMEWPFIFWIDDQIGGSICGLITFLNDFLYWSKHFSDYILFCDLDEFIETKQFNLSENKLCYAFMNKHVHLNNPVPFLETSEPIENREFTENPKVWVYKDGSKVIASTKIEVLNVHYVQKPFTDESNTEIAGKFFHVVNFTNRLRSSVHVDSCWRTGSFIPLRAIQ
jgi:hypothetical protein